jgi:hypothetical protein
MQNQEANEKEMIKKKKTEDKTNVKDSFVLFYIAS